MGRVGFTGTRFFLAAGWGVTLGFSWTGAALGFFGASFMGSPDSFVATGGFEAVPSAAVVGGGTSGLPGLVPGTDLASSTFPGVSCERASVVGI